VWDATWPHLSFACRTERTNVVGDVGGTDEWPDLDIQQRQHTLHHRYLPVLPCQDQHPWTYDRWPVSAASANHILAPLTVWVIDSLSVCCQTFLKLLLLQFFSDFNKTWHIWSLCTQKYAKNCGTKFWRILILKFLATFSNFNFGLSLWNSITQLSANRPL